MLKSPILVCALLATAGCIYSSPGPDSSGTITIDNASSHVIAEVRVTGTGRVDWGPNLLGSALNPDERFTVAVGCDTYDVLVSDDRARDCVLGNLDLCFSDSVWTIDNGTLRNCAF